MSRNGLWHSRLKLTLCSLSLLTCTFLLDKRLREIESDFDVKKPQKSDFLEDVDYALDSLDYMQKLKEFKAHVRPVVEQSQTVEEHYWSCYLKQPESVVHSSWLEQNDFHLFSAYYDRRYSSLFQESHVIQVLGMHFRRLSNETDVYCNIFTQDGSSASVKGYYREIWQRGWDPRDHFYIPYLLSCPVPERMKDLQQTYSIALSKTPCKATPTAFAVNKQQVIQENDKDDVVVCVKGMDFQEDISSSLVEWFESQFLFGANKIQLYTYTVSPKTSKVLEYYKKKKNVSVIPLTLPGNSPNIPFVRNSYIWRNRQQKRRHELIPYNDCLYRHIHSHKYILIIDTDEIVVPLKHGNYKNMLDYLERRNETILLSSLSVRNIFKFPTNQTDSRYEPYILRNNMRSRKPSAPGEYGKSFTRTSNVATVFNHFGLHRQSPDIVRTIHIPIDVAVKLHYKSKCPIESQNECGSLLNDTIADDSLEPYAQKLNKRIQDVMTSIHL
ncbi:unnamed protein product [Auanema sp. JU1783]|nr:unnamed protein product [Auanema sp. JU1783]